jgi:transmembrane protein TMEM260 (protein O-mannosyltransferase)/tetratricopeptide repeat protein
LSATKRWHAFFAAIAFGVPFFAYVRTVTPTVPFWDSGEFIATSFILGLPHPPGNPVYTMLGRMFSLVPIETVAWRVNFMSVVASALTCLFTFLFTVRALRRTVAGGRASTVAWLGCELGGLVAVFFLAFASSFWDSAIEAEVYSLSSCIIALTIWLAFNWWDHLGEPGNDRLLLLIVYILAVSTGVHLGTVLIAPGLLVLFWIVRPSYFLNAKFLVPGIFLFLVVCLVFLAGVLEFQIPSVVLPALLLFAVIFAAINYRFYVKNNLVAWWVLAIVIGFSVQIFLLIRSQQAPAINEGSPTTLAAWLEYLSRKQYGPANPFERRAELWYQIDHMYLRYVGQQWHLIERLGQLDLNSFWVKAVNAVPYLLFALGAWWNYQRDRKTFWFFFVVHLVMGPGLIFYLNFTDHEVREREYFFTNSYHFMGVWMGMGAAAAYQMLARALAPDAVENGVRPTAVARPAAGDGAAADAPVAIQPFPESLPTQVGLVLGGLTLIGISLLPMRTGWYTHDRSGFYIAHDYAYNMLVPLEKDAIVFTNGDNDTFPLWYIQEVEHVRKDVRVVNLSLLNTPWYIRQLRDQGPKVPISFTDQQLDVIGPYQDEKTGKIVWVKDLAVQDIIKTNAWRRPLYLAVTVPDQMGLEKRLTLEALVFRINTQDSGRQVDIERTLHNLYQVFLYKGLLDKNRRYDLSVYKDDNAYRLVQNYTAAHFQVAYQLQIAGKIPQAIRVLEDAAKISPDFPGLLEYLGRLYEDSGDMGAAEKIYRDGVRRFPNAPEFHFHLGVTFYQSGRIEEGIAELRRAAELNQQYFDWFSALFTALWQTGRHAEAVDVLRTWVRAHPEDRDGASYLKQYEESLRVLSGKPQPPPRTDRFPAKG